MDFLRRAFDVARLSIRTRIVTGLVAIVPVLVTGWVVWTLFRFLDGILQPIMRALLGRDIPGVGLLSTILLLYLIGLVVQNVGGRTIFFWTERVLLRLPFLRDIYGSSKQIVETFATPKRSGFRRVISFDYPREGIRAYGFVTNELRRPDGGKDVAVFLPTTPNPTSGFLLVLPASDVHDANLTVEEALKMIVSGGVVLPRPYREIVDDAGVPTTDAIRKSPARYEPDDDATGGSAREQVETSPVERGAAEDPASEQSASETRMSEERASEESEERSETRMSEKRRSDKRDSW